MNEEEARALLARRQDARSAKDFTAADALRDELARNGWHVKDSPTGPTLERASAAVVDPARVDDALPRPATKRISFQLLYEGFVDDVVRFLDGLEANNDLTDAEVVLVDNASSDGPALDHLAATHATLRVLHLSRELGWAAARNAGLKTSTGSIVVLIDLSIAPTGDVITPLIAAFDDPTIGVAGPFGLSSDDMRSWHEHPGPDVDAIEGYFMAIRRDALANGLINERFKWYRNADIDLSFQVRALGYRAVVVSLPVGKHTHRGWTSIDEPERSKRSKRNHYVFFDRWKDREDLLLSHRRGVR